MHIEDNLTLLTGILADGGSIIFPCDGIWGIGCNADNADAVERINTGISDPSQIEKEIIVADIPMLKKYSTDLHPRIETLLVYHERPIRIKCKQDLIKGESPYFRIVKDSISRILLHEVGYPIFFVSFYDKLLVKHLPLHEIKIQNHGHVSFIAKSSNEYPSYSMPLLKIEFDREGTIKVLN